MHFFYFHPSLPPSLPPYLAPAVLIKVGGKVIEIPHHGFVILLTGLNRGGAGDGADVGAGAAEKGGVLIDGGLDVLMEGGEGGREEEVSVSSVGRIRCCWCWRWIRSNYPSLQPLPPSLLPLFHPSQPDERRTLALCASKSLFFIMFSTSAAVPL